MNFSINKYKMKPNLKDLKQIYSFFPACSCPGIKKIVEIGSVITKICVKINPYNSSDMLMWGPFTASDLDLNLFSSSSFFEDCIEELNNK